MTAVLAVLLGALGSILAAELLDVCPWLAHKLLAAAARRLPAKQRGRYLAEWLAELDYMRTRTGKLLMLAWAFRVYTSSRLLAREVADMPASGQTATDQPISFRFPKPAIFYGGSTPFDDNDGFDIPTVTRELPDDVLHTASRANDNGVDMRIATPRNGVIDVQIKTGRPSSSK